jgi:hypothetical protein
VPEPLPPGVPPVLPVGPPLPVAPPVPGAEASGELSFEVLHPIGPPETATVTASPRARHIDAGKC